MGWLWLQMLLLLLLLPLVLMCLCPCPCCLQVTIACILMQRSVMGVPLVPEEGNEEVMQLCEAAAQLSDQDVDELTMQVRAPGTC